MPRQQLRILKDPSSEAKPEFFISPKEFPANAWPHAREPWPPRTTKPSCDTATVASREVVLNPRQVCIAAEVRIARMERNAACATTNAATTAAIVQYMAVSGRGQLIVMDGRAHQGKNARAYGTNVRPKIELIAVNTIASKDISAGEAGADVSRKTRLTAGLSTDGATARPIMSVPRTTSASQRLVPSGRKSFAITWPPRKPRRDDY